MDVPIFFTDALISPTITLNEETSRHIVQVLRMKNGQQVQLTDGKGTLLTAEIVDDHKKRCTVKTIDTKYLPQQKTQISIAISLLKNTSRFEWFLEKAVEFGVTEIIPLMVERTEKQHFRYERMKQIVISAMMQSKQVWLAQLHEPKSFADTVTTSAYATKLIAHCEAATKKAITEFVKPNSVQILIGPEGDFTHEEIEAALNNGYQPVALGQTRLRSETAGIAAAAMLCL